ncbi:helix-turn-helix transcriptional regulator [Neorhizobium sp. JUb45]|uniref:helix-turn-helix transcriptional regulator n=1 Tax=unclassified Neorhizobium TaxID=2629175 RepID=UPI00104BB4E7|nr:helix-turn-helix transcriptional regulator [Neorhizobium sp. JUb45]TCR04875.1 Xre family transcriptional regulator [Neorhizobium sp. JUb45]
MPGTETVQDDNLLGDYLRDRRAKLDPADFGIVASRRRTPGLRREEVAQRANVSATWYTWLEQGRGGAPSADVLDRLAKALAMSGVERDHLFLLAQHRLPALRQRPLEPVSAQLQRVLDSMEFSPALVRTALWDVVAWNDAAAAILYDYATLPAEQRNILKLVFCNPDSRNRAIDWETTARNAVAAFRAEAMRTGSMQAVQAMVEEMSAASPEFAAIWSDYDLQNYGEGLKRMRHAAAGDLSLEYSSFAVDGRQDLGLMIFTPATAADAERIRAFLSEKRRKN